MKSREKKPLGARTYAKKWRMRRVKIAISTNYALQNCKLAKMAVSISWMEFNLKCDTQMTRKTREREKTTNWQTN